MEKTGKSPPIIMNEVLVTGKVFRFTCGDAYAGGEGWFDVQVAARMVDKTMSEFPIFCFGECSPHFHLFGHDRFTPVRPEKGSYAVAGYSGSLFSTGFGQILRCGVVLGQDYALLNFQGTLNCLYAAKVSSVEQRIGSSKFSISRWELEHFALSIYKAEAEQAEREILRDKRLQGELLIETFNGKFHFAPATEDGTRVITQDGGDGIAIGRLITARVGEPMVIFISSTQRAVLTDPVVLILPDPDQE